MTDIWVYCGLFFVALAAATLLPVQSEALLLGLLLADQQPFWLLITVASLGNIAGSAINWQLGRSIEHLRDRPWFPVKAAALDRAEQWYHRHGRWSLLLSWVPIVGDPLTMIAGVLREPFVSFVLIVTMAKAGRYVAIALLTLI